MNTPTKWTLIKVASAHLFGDYGAQTTRMALHKQTNAMARTHHAGYVAASFVAAVATDSALNNRQRAAIVAINTSTHWLIDGYKLPKVIDQALHVVIALASVLFVSWRGHGTVNL